MHFALLLRKEKVKGEMIRMRIKDEYPSEDRLDRRAVLFIYAHMVEYRSVAASIDSGLNYGTTHQQLSIA